MSYVTVNHIFKKFGKQTVLDNVSLEIEEGERFGLLGPNGAGKSTLIDIMTGLIKPNSGEIRINGRQVPQEITEIRKEIGLVPQEIGLMLDLNAKSNLEYFGGLYGLSGSLLQERIDEALEAVGLDNELKKKVKSFSGGMKRRLNIAAAIMHRPKFLILDEPTVGVDPQSRHKIFEFIKQMNEEYNTTILYTSHYMEEVEALCERIYVLDDGQEVAYGTQEEIKMLVQENVKWVLEVAQSPVGFNQQVESLAGVETVLVMDQAFHLIVDPAVFNTHNLMNLIQTESLELLTLVKKELSLEEAFLQLTGKTLRDTKE